MKTLSIITAIGLISTLSISSYHKLGVITSYHSDGVDEVLNSINPPAQRTGAPGELNCTSCHSGSTQSAAGTITYSFSDLNDEYLPGQSYTVDLSIASGAKNGFEMTILDNSNNAAGTFTAGTNSSIISAGGRQYIRHSASSGVTNWSFTWNAPATDMGDLTVYYAFNASNSNGSSSNDVVYLGQETISISASASVSKYETLKNDYKVFYNDQLNELTVNYQPLTQSSVALHVLDLSGKVVYFEDLGSKNATAQTEKLNISSFNGSGVYIVSLLIDNYAVNQKVMIP